MLSSRSKQKSGGLTSLKGKNLLKTYFQDSNYKNVLCSKPSYQNLSAQEIYAKMHYMKPYIGKNVTDSLDGYFYMHQETSSKMLFSNDSCMIVHEPGTGKTITQLKTFMDLLVAKAINSFIIINLSENGNSVALNTLRTLYEEKYKKFFKPLTYEQFKRKYVDDITTSKISTYSYQDNMGIIIDEAHNLLSDNDTHKTIKVGLLKKFIDAISDKKGIKLMCSTATPFFGDPNSMGKFRSILFRDSAQTTNDIPGTMVSYIKINYDHLNIKFIQNDKYPGYGDESFIMSNGKKYDFPLYVVKPSPMQIADFYNLNFAEIDLSKIDKDRFQTYDKPLIVQSNPHLNPKTGKIETQSAIIDECVEKIKMSNDGTAIFYTDIMRKGAKVIAENLEKHGFEKYSPKASNKETSSSLSFAEIKEIEKTAEEIKDVSELIEKIKEHFTERSEDELYNLKRDYEHLKNNLEQDDIILKDIAAYLSFYEKKLERDKEYTDQIHLLEKQKLDLHQKIISMKKEDLFEKKKIFKYIVYTSNMTSEEKEAFHTFNSSKNSDGNIIKVVIFSRIGRDGIDVKHALFTFLVIPEWRIPGMIQAQHRGIRSNSHKDLIEKRAVNLQKELELEGIHISKLEAIKRIEEKRIDIEIYILLMDFDLINESDIDDARHYMVNGTENRTSSDILEFLKSEQNEHKAGKKIINAAKTHHYEVGAQFMKLVANSFDFFLNVKKNDRIKFAITDDEKKFYEQDFGGDLIAEEETEMFYIDNYLGTVKKEIENILIKNSQVNTDDLYDYFLKDQKRNLTPIIVTEAIMNLIESDYVYNSKLAIVMNVKLWETNEDPTLEHPNGVKESILFLDTCFSETKHPYISAVDSIPFSYFEISERKKTKIEKSDRDLPKKASAYNKLKDLLERALDKDYILNVNEIEFLIQLSNYWSFSWKDMDDIEDMKNKNTSFLKNLKSTKETKTLENINVYVFPVHISIPDINLLAKGVKIFEYNLISKEWKKIQSSNLKNTFFVKSSSMIELYRNTDFSIFPEFSHMVSQSKKDGYTPFDINGIVFIKGYYNPDYACDENIITQNLNHPDVLIPPINNNIILKKFNVSQSKGSQITNIFKNEISKKKAISFISEKMFSDIYMFFFLYDKSTYKSGGKPSIIDIKEHERRDMIKTFEGKPPLRYQIPIIEKTILNKERKIEIYKEIFKLPV